MRRRHARLNPRLPLPGCGREASYVCPEGAPSDRILPGLGSRLAVGQRTLDPSAGVRILPPQPEVWYNTETAHSSSGPGHRPLKAEIGGSNPPCATKQARAPRSPSGGLLIDRWVMARRLSGRGGRGRSTGPAALVPAYSGQAVCRRPSLRLILRMYANVVRSPIMLAPSDDLKIEKFGPKERYEEVRQRLLGLAPEEG